MPYPPRFPPGNRAGPGRGRAHSRAPLRNREPEGSRARRSGGRVQRGRSPLWWGFGGTPQALPDPLPAREASGFPNGNGRTAVRPYGYGNRRAAGPYRSGGRVQRGRSPLWWGLGGTPPTLPAPLPAREAGRTSGFGRDAQPCAPTESREPELEGQAAASARMRSQTCRASSRRPSPAGRLGGRT